MKARFHAVVGSVFALGAALILLNTYQAGWSCSTNFLAPTSCGSFYQFFTLELLFVSVATVELFMAARRSNTGATVWETDKQNVIRKVGILSLVIGTLLAALGLFELNNTMVVCPVLGCTASDLWEVYGAYDVSFYGGACIAALGAALVLFAALMGIKFEKWRNLVAISADQ